MKLFELVDERKLIADDAKHNKGQGIKSIVKAAKRKSNTDSDGNNYIPDGPIGGGEPSGME